MSTLIELIQKRHEGPAWVVLTEVANGTGGHAKRRADAVALGLWPSNGHLIVGYEIKNTREDVKKELRDPSKADAVGKFVDEWWLVISSEAIVDGLVVPDMWGILAPRKNVLRIVRKAPRLKPTAITRSFSAALIRKVCESWVPRHEHDALKEKQRETVIAELERERQYTRDDLQQRVAGLEQRIATFEAASGLKIDSWSAGHMGEAVRRVMELRHDLGREAHERTLRAFGHVADHHATLAARARQSAKQLRELLDTADPLPGDV